MRPRLCHFQEMHRGPRDHARIPHSQLVSVAPEQHRTQSEILAHVFGAEQTSTTEFWNDQAGEIIEIRRQDCGPHVKPVSRTAFEPFLHFVHEI